VRFKNVEVAFQAQFTKVLGRPKTVKGNNNKLLNLEYCHSNSYKTITFSIRTAMHTSNYSYIIITK